MPVETRVVKIWTRPPLPTQVQWTPLPSWSRVRFSQAFPACPRRSSPEPAAAVAQAPPLPRPSRATQSQSAGCRPDGVAACPEGLVDEIAGVDSRFARGAPRPCSRTELLPKKNDALNEFPRKHSELSDHKYRKHSE